MPRVLAFGLQKLQKQVTRDGSLPLRLWTDSTMFPNAP